jgi:hypothetical protein
VSPGRPVRSCDPSLYPTALVGVLVCALVRVLSALQSVLWSTFLSTDLPSLEALAERVEEGSSMVETATGFLRPAQEQG